LDSIDIATADAGRDGEVRHVCSTGGDLVALDKALRKLISKGHRLHVVYEAGPCGFVIWRHLTALGTQCEVVAPSSIPKRVGDRVKTDRRDAMMLARLARSGDLTAVRVPGAGDPTSAGCCIDAASTPQHPPLDRSGYAGTTHGDCAAKVGSAALIAPRPHGAPQKLFAGRSKHLLDHRACPTIGSDRGCARSILNR